MIAALKRSVLAWPVAAALLLSFGLGLYRLGYQAALGDDAFSLLIAGRDLGELLRLSASEPHPPVFYLLLWGWVRLAGDGEFAGRFVAVWWAVLSVALIYRFGRTCGGRATGSWAALLLVLNPFFVAYSQQARMYTMIIALGLASMHFMSRMLPGAGQPGRRSASAGYTLVTILAVTTHFFALFLVAAQNVLFAGLAVFRRDLRELTRWGALQAVWLLVYVPWILVAFPTLSTYRNELVSQPRLDEVYARTLRAFVLGEAGAVQSEWVLLAVLGLLALWGAWQCFRRRDWLVLTYSLLPPLIVFAVSLLRPMFFERYMLVFLPGFALLVAAAMDSLRGYLRWLALAGVLVPLTAAAMVLPGYYSQTRYATAADMRGMIAYVSAMAAPDAAVVTNLPSSDPTFGYYYRQPWSLSYLPESEDAGQLERRLEELAAAHGEIWYLPYGAERAVVEPWLDVHGVKVTDQWYSDARLTRYLLPAQGSPWQGATLDARFENGVVLTGAEPPPSGESGRPLVMRLRWQAAARVASAPKGFVHLVDDKDRIWGQWDGLPGGPRPASVWRPGELVTDTVGLVILPGTPPGRYRVVAGLYDAANGRRFAISGGDDRTVLSEVAVAAPAQPLAAGAYQIQHSRSVEPVGGLRLAGVSLARMGGGSGERVSPGQILHVTTFWQADAGVAATPALALVLATPDGRIVATASPGPLEGLGSPVEWRTGEIMRGQSYLFLPADIAPGVYRVQLGAAAGPAVVIGETVVVAP